MNEIPTNASFVKELDYVHIVLVAFMNEHNKVEIGAWAYQHQEDAQKRYEKIMETHSLRVASGLPSPLVSTVSYHLGIYENFEQSIFAEGVIGERVM